MDHPGIPLSSLLQTAACVYLINERSFGGCCRPTWWATRIILSGSDGRLTGTQHQEKWCYSVCLHVNNRREHTQASGVSYLKCMSPRCRSLELRMFNLVCLWVRRQLLNRAHAERSSRTLSFNGESELLKATSCRRHDSVTLQVHRVCWRDAITSESQILTDISPTTSNNNRPLRNQAHGINL